MLCAPLSKALSLCSIFQYSICFSDKTFGERCLLRPIYKLFYWWQVLQALRRLKGNSKDRKEKMSDEIKHIFDKLTEDAMKLMDNGEYS